MGGLPDDDLQRALAVARPADPDPLHLAVVGDIYTVLLSGEQKMLCAAVPAGLEVFVAEFGDRVDSRTAPPPDLSDEEKQTRLRRAIERAPDYGMELLSPSE